MSSKNTLLPVQTMLQSGGRLLDISNPVVMGILNATPNSFYNKGRESSTDDLLRTAEKMLQEGATILDIGGASSKPGEELSTASIELERVTPVIEAIQKQFPGTWLSIDTYHAQVARESVAAGAAIINDISAGSIDKEMMATVARLKVPYIAMHMQGTPLTMQNDPQYENAVTDIRNYLSDTCYRAKKAGITDIIIDPGFGFGKTIQHNFALLKQLQTFRILGKPVLAGISRKSMICKPLKVNPEHALNGTTALHMVALQNGANILRVHDVKEAMEVIRLYKYLQ